VEAKTAWIDFMALTNAAALWLFASRHGSPAVIPAAIIGGVLFGFLFAYLYTQLIVARLIAQADVELGGLPEPSAVSQLTKSLGSFGERIVPRISRSALDPQEQQGLLATPEEVAAAAQYHLVRLNDLDNRADVMNWARAKAVLNDYGPAAEGYVRLLGMVDGGAGGADPGLLIEAARVLYAAGRTTEAIAFAELALQRVDTAEPQVQEIIIGDCAALRLARRVPGGYRAALDLLNRYLERPQPVDKDSSGRLHLLRALAKGQQWHALPADNPARQTLRQEILDDLRFAFTPNRQPLAWNSYFWDPNAQRPPGRMPGDNEDDPVGIVTQADIDALHPPQH
jgi:hypothetical protein